MKPTFDNKDIVFISNIIEEAYRLCLSKKNDGKEDAFSYAKICAIVIREQKGRNLSIPFLQRKFKMSYQEAQKILDEIKNIRT